MGNDKQKQRLFVWTDVETTGLDPNGGKLLEVGMILTTREMREVARMSWVINHERADVLAALEHDNVFAMHHGSGLLAEVYKSTVNIARAESQAVSFLRRTALEAVQPLDSDPNNPFASGPHDSYTLHFAGSSVHFDRDWLRVHMPAVADIFHHRMLDVSVYKLAFPGLLTQPEGPVAHRAMADLEYSIGQHKQMMAIVAAGDERLMIDETAART